MTVTVNCAQHHMCSGQSLLINYTFKCIHDSQLSTALHALMTVTVGYLYQ